MMHKQIPSIGSQGTCKEGTAGNEIDERETDPDLPENFPDRLIRVCVMQSMLFGQKLVEYESMKNIFGKGPHDDTRDEKLRGESHSQRRDRQQNDCQQRRNEDFAEKEDDGHEPSLVGRPSLTQRRLGQHRDEVRTILIEAAATASSAIQ